MLGDRHFPTMLFLGYPCKIGHDLLSIKQLWLPVYHWIKITPQKWDKHPKMGYNAHPIPPWWPSSTCSLAHRFLMFQWGMAKTINHPIFLGGCVFFYWLPQKTQVLTSLWLVKKPPCKKETTVKNRRDSTCQDYLGLILTLEIIKHQDAACSAGSKFWMGILHIIWSYSGQVVAAEWMLVTCCSGRVSRVEMFKKHDGACRV